MRVWLAITATGCSAQPSGRRIDDQYREFDVKFTGASTPVAPLHHMRREPCSWLCRFPDDCQVRTQLSSGCVRLGSSWSRTPRRSRIASVREVRRKRPPREHGSVPIRFRPTQHLTARGLAEELRRLRCSGTMPERWYNDHCDHWCFIPSNALNCRPSYNVRREPFRCFFRLVIPTESSTAYIRSNLKGG